jgi:hypothetical protein
VGAADGAVGAVLGVGAVEASAGALVGAAGAVRVPLGRRGRWSSGCKGKTSSAGATTVVPGGAKSAAEPGHSQCTHHIDIRRTAGAEGGGGEGSHKRSHKKKKPAEPEKVIITVSPRNNPEESIAECCHVCWDGESYDNDPILLCEDCDVAVHQSCYGIANVPKVRFAPLANSAPHSASPPHPSGHI